MSQFPTRPVQGRSIKLGDFVIFGREAFCVLGIFPRGDDQLELRNCWDEGRLVYRENVYQVVEVK